MVALVFPGQGSQAVGMDRDLAERFPEARQTVISGHAAGVGRAGALCKERGAKGVTHFVALGPGKVLSGMIRRAARGATVANVADGDSFERTREGLA